MSLTALIGDDTIVYDGTMLAHQKKVNVTEKTLNSYNNLQI